MLCSVKKKKKNGQKIYRKIHGHINLNLNIPLFRLMFTKWVVVKFWGGFITGLQIYTEKHRS